MTPANPAPLQVGLCLKAVKRMQKIVDDTSTDPWRANGNKIKASAGVIAELPTPSTTGTFNWLGNRAFIVAARSVLGPMLAFLAWKLTCFSPDIKLVPSGTFHAETMELYPVLAAIVAHLDQTSPGWRDEPESEVGG